MRPDELERLLRERLDALGPAPRAELLSRPDAARPMSNHAAADEEQAPCGIRAELLHVLMLPDLERADRIGEFWGYPESRVRLVRDRIEHEVGLESCFLH